VLHSGSNHDLSRSVFSRKQKAYGKLKNLHIVTPSRWLADRVFSGSLLGNRPVTVIPNGLDINIFTPSKKSEARRTFNLPEDKKIILFGGVRGAEYRLKGFHLLVEALKTIRRDDLELVVFGSSSSKLADTITCKTHFLGHIESETELAVLYNAADVAVVPSYQEVFGQTASEALSCGLPVVAFATSGLLDIVDHKKNGYLATPFKPDDLAEGITWVLETGEKSGELSQAARLKAETHFDIRIVARQYETLYGRILNGESAE